MDDREWLRELAALISERQHERPAADEVNVLALLAEDPRNGLVELAPGVYTSERRGWGANS